MSQKTNATNEAAADAPAAHVHVRNTHIVLRPFHAERPLDRGEHVDTRNWTTTPSLERHGYIRRLDPHEIAPGADCSDCCI